MLGDNGLTRTEGRTIIRHCNLNLSYRFAEDYLLTKEDALACLCRSGNQVTFRKPSLGSSDRSDLSGTSTDPSGRTNCLDQEGAR